MNKRVDILKFKPANCKNCFKCIRECPVKAINFSEGQAQIINRECVLCGRCVISCPQNAKTVNGELDFIKEAISEGKKVVASVAPSFISNYGVSGFAGLQKVLLELGFAAADETAKGARIVKNEYARILQEEKPKVLITTCCPTAVMLVEKYYPDLTAYLAHTVTPMAVHSRMLREQLGEDIVVVFIGPCLSKKAEITRRENNADYVLSFEELDGWLQETGKQIEENCPAPQVPGDDAPMRSRFFPESGGIIKSMERLPNYNYVYVDGIENIKIVLEEVAEGNLENYLLELSACVGSCINGPFVSPNRGGLLVSRARVNAHAQSAEKIDFSEEYQGDLKRSFYPEVMSRTRPGEAQIDAILAKIGKTKKEDELNCGACGYHSCRDKAAAVFLGKAELTMCLPYMKERAESMSDRILEAAPNAVIALDKNLIISQINYAAKQLFELGDRNVVGLFVDELLEANTIRDVVLHERNISSRKVYLEKQEKYVDESIIFDKNANFTLILMRDITEDTTIEQKQQALRENTITITDEIITKQMRVVQEIASLLGETTAETKIALTKLKRIFSESEEGK